MCHGGDDGLWGPEQSRARPASRTWRACRVFSISTRKRAGGQVAELQISPCLQRLPVRRPIDHWLDSGRSPRPPTPASPATSPPTGRWPGAYCCRIRQHSARSVGAVSPCPAHEMLPVASCSKSTTILPVRRVGGVLCRRPYMSRMLWSGGARQESRLRNSWGWRLGAVLNSPGKHPFALDRRLDAGSGGPAARREVEVGLFRRVADRASEHRWVTDAGRAPRGVAGGALVMSPGVRAGRR